MSIVDDPLFQDSNATAFLPSAQEQAAQRGLVGQALAATGRAALNIAQMPVEAASAIPGVRAYAQPAAEWLEERKPVSSGKPFEQGLEMGLTGVGTAVATGLTMGPVAGAITTAALFGGSTVAQTRTRLEKLNETLVAHGSEPMSEEQITLVSLGAGAVMGGGQALIGRFLQGAMGKGGAEAAKDALLARFLPDGAKQLLAKVPGAMTYVQTAMQDVPIFAGQAGATAGMERGVLSAQQLQTLKEARQEPPTALEAATGMVGPAAVAAIPGAIMRGVTQRPRPQPQSTSSGASQAIGNAPTAEPTAAPEPTPPGAASGAPAPTTNAEARMPGFTGLAGRAVPEYRAPERAPEVADQPVEPAPLVRMAGIPGLRGRVVNPDIAANESAPHPQTAALATDILQALEQNPYNQDAFDVAHAFLQETVAEPGAAGVRQQVQQAMQYGLDAGLRPTPSRVQMQTTEPAPQPATAAPASAQQAETLALREPEATTTPPAQAGVPAVPAEATPTPGTPPPQEPAATPVEPTGPQYGRTSRVQTEENRVARDLGLPGLDTQLVIEDVNAARHSFQPDYPAEKQPRVGRQPGQPPGPVEEQKLTQMLARPDFDRMGDDLAADRGAPIRDAEGDVLSGNLRDEFLRRLYAQGGEKADQWRQQVRDRAQDLGIDPATIQGIENPVIRRVLTTDLTPEQKLRFAQEANVGASQAPDAASAALQDASRLTSRHLADLQVLQNGLLDLNSPGNDAFRRWLRQDVFPTTEQGALINKDGKLTDAGMDRARNALFVMGYGPESRDVLTRMATSDDVSRKRLASALGAKAGVFAKMANEIEQGRLADRNPAPAIVEAANAFETVLKDTTPSDYFAQRGMFEQPEERLSPLAQNFLRLFDDPFYKNSGAKTQALLQKYSDLVSHPDYDPRQTALEPTAIPSREAFLLAADQRVREESGNGQAGQAGRTGRLFPAAQRPSGRQPRGGPAAGGEGPPGAEPARPEAPAGATAGAEGQLAVPGAAAGEQQLAAGTPFRGYAYRERAPGQWEITDPQGRVDPVAPATEAYARARIVRLANEATGEPQGAPAPGPEGMQGLPAYLTERLEQARTQAQRLGLTDDIQRLSSQGLVAKEVAQRLQDKFPARMDALDRLEMIRAVREQNPEGLGPLGQLHVTTEQAQEGQPRLTQDDVARAFPRQRVEAGDDGSFTVHTQGGHEISVERVDQISPTRAEIQLSTGKATLFPGERVAGRITEKAPALFRIEIGPEATNLTLLHEAGHFFEDAGLLTQADVRALNATLLRQGQEATAETRADFIAQAVSERGAQYQGPLGQIVRKVQAWLDRLAQAVGITTSGQVIRRIESGMVFEQGQGADGLPTGRLAIGPVTLKRPFDLDAPVDLRGLTALRGLGEDAARGVETNRDMLSVLREQLGDTSEVHDWLAANGYDGIVRTTGQGERRTTAFDPATIVTEASPGITREEMNARMRQHGVEPFPEFPGGPRRPGRLSVVEQSQVNQPLPGMEKPAEEAKAVPEPPRATPRHFATFTPEVHTISLLHYADFANMIPAEHVAELQTAVQNRTFVYPYSKEFIPRRQIDEGAATIRAQWAEDPALRVKFLEGLNQPGRADRPGAADETQARALRDDAAELYQIMYHAHAQGITSDGQWGDFLHQWNQSNSIAQAAATTMSTFGRGLGDVANHGVTLMRRAQEHIDALAGQVPEADRQQMLDEMQRAMGMGDYDALKGLADRVPPGAIALLKETFYTSALSNPATLVKKTVSVLGHILFNESVVQGLGGTIDAQVAPYSQRERQVYRESIGPRLAAGFSPSRLGQGAREFWWLWTGDPQAGSIPGMHFRHGFEESSIGNVGAPTAFGQAQFRGQPIEPLRRIAPIMTSGTRAFQAMGVALRHLAFDTSMAGYAREEGLRTFGSVDRIPDTWEQEWTTTQIETNSNWVEQANSRSEKLTFQDEMSGFGKMLAAGSRLPGVAGLAWDMILPFKATPDRLLARGLELIPGTTVLPWAIKNMAWQGWLPRFDAATAFKDPNVSLMLAKQLIGAVMIGGISAAWANGSVTGQAPKDPAERDAFYRQGKLPFAVRLGNEWVSYEAFHPLNLPLATATAGIEAAHRLLDKHGDDPEIPTNTMYDAMAALSVGAQGMISHVIESSYFSGLASFFEGTTAGRESGGGIPRGAMRVLSTLVTPFQGLQRGLVRSIDSMGIVPGTEPGQAMVRSPSSFGEMIAANSLLAYTSMAPPVRLDIFGRPQYQNTTPPEGVLSPVRRHAAIEDDVENTLRDLQYYPGGMAKSDALGKPYEAEDYRAMTIRRGELMQDAMERLIMRPSWGRLSEDDQREQLRQAVSAAGRRARTDVLRGRRETVNAE